METLHAVQNSAKPLSLMPPHCLTKLFFKLTIQPDPKDETTLTPPHRPPVPPADVTLDRFPRMMSVFTLCLLGFFLRDITPGYHVDPGPTIADARDSFGANLFARSKQ